MRAVIYSLLVLVLGCSPPIPYRATLTALPRIHGHVAPANPELIVFVSTPEQITLDQVISWDNSGFSLGDEDDFRLYTEELLLQKLSGQGFQAAISPQRIKDEKEVAGLATKAGARLGLFVSLVSLSAVGDMDRREPYYPNDPITPFPMLYVVALPFHILIFLGSLAAREETVEEEYQIVAQVSLFDTKTNKEIYKKTLTEKFADTHKYPPRQSQQPDLQGRLLLEFLPRLAQTLSQETRAAYALSEAESNPPRATSQPSKTLSPTPADTFLPPGWESTP